MDHREKLLDLAAGTSAAASPWWLDYLDVGAQRVALYAGCVLVLLRVYVAARDAYARYSSDRNGGR